MFKYIYKLYDSAKKGKSAPAVRDCSKKLTGAEKNNSDTDSRQGDDRTPDTALESLRLQIERKIFYLDLKQNASGRFLRITEEVGGRRDTIIVPATGLPEFRDAIDQLIHQSV